MKNISWVWVNCDRPSTASRLGEACLSDRLIACYDVLPRSATGYFWPPQAGRIERGRGAALVLVTLPRVAARVRRKVRQLHRDALPFIGQLTIQAESAYYAWVSREISTR